MIESDKLKEIAKQWDEYFDTWMQDPFAVGGKTAITDGKMLFVSSIASNGLDEPKFGDGKIKEWISSELVESFQETIKKLLAWCPNSPECEPCSECHGIGDCNKCDCGRLHQCGHCEGSGRVSLPGRPCSCRGQTGHHINMGYICGLAIDMNRLRKLLNLFNIKETVIIGAAKEEPFLVVRGKKSTALVMKCTHENKEAPRWPNLQSQETQLDTMHKVLDQTGPG